MALRAYWEQENTNGVTDRIEVYDSSFSGTAFEMGGDETGFNFSHVDTTSESTAKLLNVHANPIQIGRLDFRPRIESDEGFSLLEDIRDSSDGKRFHIVKKEGGSFDWCGYVTTKVFVYPERKSSFIAHIRAEDFEWMKGEDYTKDDTRQTLITTLADLLSGLPETVKIKTATSWITENTTDSTDFLSQVYHETKALREFARTGDETDQPIKKWDALHHMTEPALLIRQMKGYIFIDQLTELADPTSVSETIYNANGTVDTATTTVDRRQTGYKDADSGTPSVKVTSQNHTYPAIKEAKVKFDHRSNVSGIQLPEEVTVTSSKLYSQEFISDGGQYAILEANVRADLPATYLDSGGNIVVQTTSATVDWEMEAEGYWWNNEDRKWESSLYTNTTDLTVVGSEGQAETASDTFMWEANIWAYANGIPSDADGDFNLTIKNVDYKSDTGDGTEDARWAGTFELRDQISKFNSTHIDYSLTQGGSFPGTYKHADTFFGSLGVGPSALRFSSSDGDILFNNFQRRGSASYRSYHENLLKEPVDLQRTGARKIEANIYGDYDPSKVLSYDGSYFYYAGGNFDGTVGRWTVTLFELNIQTGTDTFDENPKFRDEGGSSTSPSGVNSGVANNKYFQVSNNLSEGTASTIRSNIGLVIGTDVQAYSDDLKTYDDNPLTASELGQLQNIGSNTISATQWGYLGAMDQDVHSGANVTFVDQTLTGDLTVQGNITQQGEHFITDAEKVEIADNMWFLNKGETGSTITEGLAGTEVDFGSGDPYRWMIDTASGFFRLGEYITTFNISSVSGTFQFNEKVTGGTSGETAYIQVVNASTLKVKGVSGDFTATETITGATSGATATLDSITITDNTQAVLTREDSPTDTGIHYYDASANQAVTDAGLTFDGSVLSTPSLTSGVTHIDSANVASGDLWFRFAISGANKWGLSPNLETDKLTLYNYIDGNKHVSFNGDLTTRFYDNVRFDNRMQFESWHFEYNAANRGMKFTETGVSDRHLFHDGGGVSINTLSLEGYTGANINGTTNIKDTLTVEAAIEADNFALTTDFSGTGWQGKYAGDFNVRNLVVREAARFRELIIDQLGIIAGSDMRSIARGKIASIDTGTNQITLEDPNSTGASQFVADDFFWVKALDINNADIIDLKGQVTTVSGTTLTLDTTVTGGTHAGTTTDISSLSVGDVIMQRGHPTNAARQALIYTTVSDSDAPVQKYFTGIDSLGAFNATANIGAQVGTLDALTSTYANVTGEGFFSSNFYATDSILVGDLGKSSDYIEYASGSLSADLSSLEIDATEVYISSSNKTVAVGADGSAVTVANTTAGTVMEDTGFKSYLDASNYIRRDGSALDINFTTGSIVSGNLDLSADAASSYLSIGSLTGISDTTNKGFYVNNDGELLARQDGDNYLKIFDDAGTPTVDLATQSLTVSIDASNSITADATGVAVNATSFNLNASNVNIGESSGWFGASDVLAYNADGSVDVAGFSVNNRRLSDGNVFIGNNLSLDDGANKLLVGNYSDGTTPAVKVVGNDANNFVQMVGRSTSSANFFNVRQAGTNVVAVSGDAANFFGMVADAGKLYTGDATNGYVGMGATSAASDPAFWAGADNQDGSGGTSANNFLVTQDGHAYYAAMGGSIFARSSVAGFTTGDNASSITSSYWVEEVTDVLDDGTAQKNSNQKIRVKYYHRFGINKLIIKGNHKVVESGDPASSFSRIYADLGGSSNSVETQSSSYTEFKLDISTSGLTEGNFYELVITLESETNLSSGGSSSTAEARLREDVYITTST